MPKLFMHGGRLARQTAPGFEVASRAVEVVDLTAQEYSDVAAGVYGPEVAAYVTKARANQLGSNFGAGLNIVPTVIFGSSTDAHCHATMVVDITVLNEVATITVTESPTTHLIGDGTKVWLGIPDPTPGSFTDRRQLGIFRRISGSQGTVVVPGWPNGSGSTKMSLMSAYGPASWYRDLNGKLGGALQLIAPFALPGETTDRKVQEFPEVLALKPKLIIGAWGIGNDVLQSATANTVTNIRSMLSAATGQGIICAVGLPPASVTLTPLKASEGTRVVNQIREEWDNHPLVVFIDEMLDTLDPDTGVGKPIYFTDGVHANSLYSLLKATRWAEALKPLVPTIRRDRLIAGKLDSVHQEPTLSKQFMEFWDSAVATVTAASIETGAAGKVSGNVPRAVTKITTTGNASRSAAFSLVADPTGVGRAMQIVFTAGAANDVLYFELTGHAGFEFWRYIQQGVVHRPACTLKITPSTGGVTGYEHFITLNTGSNVRVSEHNRSTHAAPDSVLTSEVYYDQAIWPEFTVNAVPTDGKWTFQMTASKAGIVTIQFGRPTLRAKQ